jgi:dienelactone hydrolase
MRVRNLRLRPARVGLSVLVLSVLAVGLTAPSSDAATTKFTSMKQFAKAEVAYYQSQLPPGLVVNCLAPAGNPVFGTAAWELRDLENQYCATGRLQDEIDNPAFGFALDSQLPANYVQQLLTEVGQPGHLAGGLTTLVPGASEADPFRTLNRWTEAGRGRVTPVSFFAQDGAELRGYVFEPPANDPPPPGGYPGVVITDGSIQGYQQLYFWAAEGLAEAGYMTMTYDVQGQGQSDLLPADCLHNGCPGVPYQQNYNFYQGAEDSLSFFLSTPAAIFGGRYNPDYANLNPNEIGIAGHSLGAAAVSEVGQCDRRVKAIVAWDNLSPISGCGDVTVPKADRSPTLLHAPALALTNDYFLNPEPMTSVPNPHAKDQGYQQLVSHGLDSAEIALRGTTHLTYTYIPYVLPAGSLAERFAFYYTLAWFDYELRGEQSGFDRLVATTYNNSADIHSIGAGTFDPGIALTDPLNVNAANVPYRISGIPVANSLSIYYESEYSIRNRSTGALATCVDMRANCPAVAPPVP